MAAQIQDGRQRHFAKLGFDPDGGTRAPKILLNDSFSGKLVPRIPNLILVWRHDIIFTQKSKMAADAILKN